MKTKILSLAIIAGVFTGCSQFNLPNIATTTSNGHKARAYKRY